MKLVIVCVALLAAAASAANIRGTKISTVAEIERLMAAGSPLPRLKELVDAIKDSINKEQAEDNANAEKKCTKDTSATIEIKTTETDSGYIKMQLKGCASASTCKTESDDNERDYAAKHQCNLDQLSISKAKASTADVIRSDIAYLNKKISDGDATRERNAQLSKQRIKDHDNAIAALKEIDAKLNADTGDITNLLEKRHEVALRKLNNPEVNAFVEMLHNGVNQKDSVKALKDLVTELIAKVTASNATEKAEDAADAERWAGEKLAFQNQISTKTTQLNTATTEAATAAEKAQQCAAEGRKAKDALGQINRGCLDAFQAFKSATDGRNTELAGLAKIMAIITEKLSGQKSGSLEKDSVQIRDEDKGKENSVKNAVDGVVVSDPEDSTPDSEDHTFGMGDFTKAYTGWKLLTLAELSGKYKASFIEDYNKYGIKTLEAWRSTNCCFSFANGKRLTINGANSYMYPATTSGSTQCNPRPSYKANTLYKFHRGMKQLNPDSTTFGEVSRCATNNNPGIFVKV